MYAVAPVLARGSSLREALRSLSGERKKRRETGENKFD